MNNKIWCTVWALVLFISILACSTDDDDDINPPLTTATCGGVAGQACVDADESCYFEQSQNCGADDAVGTCGVPPEICTREYAPVCGCDGRTYGNSCEARGAGVSVQSQGECPTSGQTCGTRGADACPTGEVCIHEPSANCGRTDHPGACQLAPEYCTFHYQPVCGCDGRTYSNACMANAAGVSVDFEGSCVPDDAHCTRDCTDSEFCPLGPNCSTPTEATSCQLRPEACTMQYDPVCGCDGRTYGNSCGAASHGVSVAYTGECLPSQ
ncbi:MAG: Kazal-type serine protease inhibitor family protein [Bradymonadaceae bacterium]